MAEASPAIPADEDCCTRSGFNNWRCPFPRHGGKRYCLKHHLAELEYSSKSKPAARYMVSNPSINSTTSKITRTSARVRARQQGSPSRVSDPKSGEIWAFPLGSDNFPRFYARIDRIVVDSSSNQPSVEATPLIRLPVSDDELISSDNGFILPTGTFRSTSEAKITMPISALSHRVSFKLGKWRAFYKIFPKKGDIWAVYQNYNGLKKSLEYKLVEVLSDFNEEEGVNVLGLVKVADNDGVYKRQMFEGFNMIRNIPKRDLSMFSHQVPASRIVDGGEMLWMVMSR